jgi:hypothetical protein
MVVMKCRAFKAERRRDEGGDSRRFCCSSFIDVAFVDGDGDDVRVRRDVESL